jgi:hypothetical protein
VSSVCVCGGGGGVLRARVRMCVWWWCCVFFWGGAADTRRVRHACRCVRACVCVCVCVCAGPCGVRSLHAAESPAAGGAATTAGAQPVRCRGAALTDGVPHAFDGRLAAAVALEPVRKADVVKVANVLRRHVPRARARVCVCVCVCVWCGVVVGAACVVRG